MIRESSVSVDRVVPGKPPVLNSSDKKERAQIMSFAFIREGDTSSHGGRVLACLTISCERHPEYQLPTDGVKEIDSPS